MFVLFGSVTGLCGHTHGLWELLDSASTADKLPLPVFVADTTNIPLPHKLLRCTHLPPACLPLALPQGGATATSSRRNGSVPAARSCLQCRPRRARHSASTALVPNIRIGRYGKVVPEFFEGSVASHNSLLSILIRVDKHPELLGAVQLASTLAAVGAAVVTELVPTLPVPDLGEGSIDAALEMDLDAPIPLGKRKCPGVLPRQAPTLQQRR